MLKVVDVHFESAEHLCHGVGISVVECRLRCESGAHLVDDRIAVGVLHYLVDEVLTFRAGAYERHIAFENIPQLWQFVEMVVAQESLKTGGIAAVAGGYKLRPLPPQRDCSWS